MKITEKQLQNVLKKLERWSGYQKCNMCGEDTWNVADTLFEFREFSGGGLSSKSAILPTVIITCAKCGNMHFLNAIQFGLVTRDGILIKEANNE